MSSYGYTDPAVTTCKDALPLKTIVLCSLDEIVQGLEAQVSFTDLLKEKIRAAVIEKNPLHRRVSYLDSTERVL